MTSAMFDVFGESVDFNAVIKLRLRWGSLENLSLLTRWFELRGRWGNVMGKLRLRWGGFGESVVFNVVFKLRLRWVSLANRGL